MLNEGRRGQPTIDAVSVPSRVEAAAIVRSMSPSDKLLRHSAAVAEVAAFLCAAMVGRGIELDATRIETAALLHDIDKMLPADDPLRALGHGPAGAEWLRRHGCEELADAVAQHPVMMLGRAPTYDSWADAAGFEGRVVFYSDKRARQRLVTLDDRFADWYDRYPDSPELSVAHERARRLEKVVCSLAGVRPRDVDRQAWVEEAVRDAA